MLSLNATQLAIVAADNKDDISWLFQIDRTGNDVINDYWSTKVKTWDGHNYTFKVIDFSDIEMNRAQSESGIQAPSEFTFTITNKDNALTTADFSSARINLLLVVKAGANEAEIRSWSFRITEVDPGYQKLTFHCVDWLQAHLEGDYPKTTIVEDLFVNPAIPPPDGRLARRVFELGYIAPVPVVASICVPVILGRPCIPVIPIYIGGGSPYFGYLLGPTTGTPSDYDVYNVKTPSDWDGEAKSFSKNDYTFSYIDKTGRDGNDYTCGVFTIIDSDNDGNADANIKYIRGDQALPIPAEYEENSTKDKTAPADILEYVLEAWGIPSAKIDATTQAAANTTYAGWGLTWNIGLFNKEPRKKLLARLMQMCHTELIVRDKIYFKVHSKTSQMTLNKAHIIKENERGEGTFKYEMIEKKDEKDSGYIAYQVQGGCLDELIKVRVTVKGTYNNTASDIISADYVQDSQAAQKLGMLALQRKFLPLAKARFKLKGTCLALECDDIVTLSHADYGGTYNVLIDSITINKDLSIDIESTRFSQDLDDWGDLAPGAITMVSDNYTNYIQVVTSGPDAKDSAGNQIGNVLKGRLRIGETGNHILFDPAEPIIKMVEGGVTRMNIGDIGTNDYVIEFLDHAGNSIFKLDGSGNNTICGWAGTDKKFTCQSGQVGMNAEETGGTDWRFWAGHATPGSAPFRVDENGNLHCTLIYATGGTIGGWTIGATKISITGIELDQANNRIRAFTGANYVDMTAGGLTGYDSVLGTTFKLLTDGSAPEFSSGIIKECVYEIYTSGVIRTNANPSANGGLIINNTDIKGYTSAGLKVLQLVYNGTDQGDAYIGDFDNTNPGLKYDQSAGLLNYRGSIIITGGSGIASLSDAGALATVNDLDGVPNGSSYGRVVLTAISGGKIVLTSAGVTGTLPTSLSVAKCTDPNADQTSAHGQNLGWLIGSTGTLTISAAGKISINTADALEIQAAGNINVLAGGDIVMTPSNTNPSLIKWGAKVYEGIASTDARGLCIWPETAKGPYFHVGYDPVNNTNKYMGNINFYGSGYCLYRSYYDANNYGGIYLNSTATTGRVDLQLRYGGTSRNIFFRNSDMCFSISNHKEFDFGLAASAWDDAYADDWHNVADFYCLDDYNDLKAILDIKPSGIIDKRTGLPLIDDNSIPEWLLTRHKKDTPIINEHNKMIGIHKKGEIARDPEDKPYLSTKIMLSLLMGAVKQLDQKIINLEKR